MSKHRIPQPFNAIDLTPRTLGALADYNKKHMSSDEYSEKVQKMANERRQLTQYCGKIPEGAELKDKSSFKEMPWSKDTISVEKINKMDGQQKRDYVLENKVPIGL